MSVKNTTLGVAVHTNALGGGGGGGGAAVPLRSGVFVLPSVCTSNS